MRILLSACLLAAVLVTPSVSAQRSPFLGSWNLTGTGDDASFVYWLKVEQGPDGLTGRFLNRTGSPVTLGVVKIENGELVFQMGRPDNLTGPEFRAKFENGRLIGRHMLRQGGGRRGGGEPPTERQVNWIGVPTPTWPAANASAPQKFGTPVVLFDAAAPSMDAWGVQFPDRPVNWSVVEGLLQNQPPANNLVSKAKFSDFKLEAEYRLSAKSNSGLYLRGRYEMQLFDDAGQPAALTGHMSIYGRKAADTNASLPPGEWQRTEIVLVGNRVTVTLNGTRIHDNAVIEGITGGALDNDELAPGPIMIQGDHTLASFRKIVITPIVK
ncbi:MAG: DUF1080 domain-containing protein [Acidimicrobiia bacterium]|nr:DUF1080 domain-containing protein [Acidimicrobiia bacterium]